MARGRHYAQLSLSNAARLSFSDLCILLLMFLSLCRLCVCVFLCSHWSLVDVPLIFFCPADHVPDWQPRVLLGMVEARSVNVKKTTTTTWCRSAPLRGPSANGYDAWRFGSCGPVRKILAAAAADLVWVCAPPRTIRKWLRRLAFWILRTRAQDPCSCCLIFRTKVDEKVDNSGWRIKIVAACGYTHQIVGQKWVPGGALLSRGSLARRRAQNIVQVHAHALNGSWECYHVVRIGLGAIWGDHGRRRSLDFTTPTLSEKGVGIPNFVHFPKKNCALNVFNL